MLVCFRRPFAFTLGHGRAESNLGDAVALADGTVANVVLLRRLLQKQPEKRHEISANLPTRRRRLFGLSHLLLQQVIVFGSILQTHQAEL